MQLLTLEAYRAAELGGTAREHAMNALREIDDRSDWMEDLTEPFEEDMEEFGFRDVEVSIGLAYSQGDGASFLASVDAAEYLRAHRLGNRFRLLLQVAEDRLKSASGEIRLQLRRRHWGHYVHEQLLYVEDDSWLETEDADLLARYAEQTTALAAHVLSLARARSRALYEAAHAEGMRRYREEHLLDLAAADDLWFDERGRRIAA